MAAHTFAVHREAFVSGKLSGSPIAKRNIQLLFICNHRRFLPFKGLRSVTLEMKFPLFLRYDALIVQYSSRVPLFINHVA